MVSAETLEVASGANTDGFRMQFWSFAKSDIHVMFTRILHKIRWQKRGLTARSFTSMSHDVRGR